MTTLPTTATASAVTSFGASGIELRTFDDAARFAKAVFESGLAPNGFKSPQAVMVAMQAGMEVGLPPMQAIQSVAVINGRPCMWGDALPALLWAAGFHIEETISPEGTVAACTIIRPNGARITRAFSVDDAKAAGLHGKSGPWSQYPKRMLQMRARSWACRDGAADVLRGMVVREEAEDTPPMRDITPPREFPPAVADVPVPEPDEAQQPQQPDLSHEVLTFRGQSWSRSSRGAQEWANAIGKAAAERSAAGDTAGARAVFAEYGPQLEDVLSKLPPTATTAIAAIGAVLAYGEDLGNE